MTIAEKTAPVHELTSGKPQRAPERHAEWVDQWLIAEGSPLRTLVAEVRAEVEAWHTRVGTYRRALRAEHAKTADDLLETMLANLARLALRGGPGDRLALHRNNGGRGRSRQYDRVVFGDVWERQKPALEALDVLHYRRGMAGATRGEAPSVSPTPEFVARVLRSGVTLDDLGRHESEPVLILARTKGDESGHRRREEFAETSETTALRSEMNRLNAFLREADIAFEDDGEYPRVDARSRRLRRHFILLDGQQEARFDQGGRLFGGFWMSLKKHRRQHIRINGEPVAILDFSAMATRLAYARRGVEPPNGDPYAIPRFTQFRKDLKTLMNCLWFDAWDRKRWPKEMREDAARPDAVRIGETGSIIYGRRRRLSETLNAIRDHHPLIADMFGSRVGDLLMYQESQILLTSLGTLMDDGVVGLGLHDGVMVPASKAEHAKTVMERAAIAVCGAEIPVRIE